MDQVPHGFVAIARASPYADLLGPIYQKSSGAGLVIGIIAQEKHCNLRGHVHGGVLGALADIAMGYSAAFSTDPPTAIVTVSQTIDFVGRAEVGQWIEIHTDVQKMGSKLAFVSCYFHSGSRRIARSSAVFSVMTP